MVLAIVLAMILTTVAGMATEKYKVNGTVVKHCVHVQYSFAVVHYQSLYKWYTVTLL